MVNSGRLDGLLTLRFVAAAMIVLFHLALLPSLPMSQNLVFIPHTFGIGVPLFYVISSFSLYIGYSHRLVTREQIRTYFVRRFFRIAPLFYVMMAVYFVYLYLEYGAIIPFSKIFTSATFLFNFVPADVEGYVWASWSIGVEMAFYFIFPVVVFAVTNIQRAVIFFLFATFLSISWHSAFAGAITPALVNFGNYGIVFHLPAFAAGIVAFYVWSAWHRNSFRFGWLLTLAGFAAIVMTFGFPYVAAIGGVGAQRATLMAAFAAIAVGVALSPFRLMLMKLFVELGRASFSLYLFHPLIIGILMNRGVFVFLYGIIHSYTLSYLLCAGLTFAILLPAALLSYRYIERPGIAIGGRVLSRAKWSVGQPVGLATER